MNEQKQKEFVNALAGLYKAGLLSGSDVGKLIQSAIKKGNLE